MRNLKPILQINKFSGSGENGILYCDGLYPEVDNGKSVMGDGFVVKKVINSNTTGFTSMQSIYGSVSLSTIEDPSINYNLYIDNNPYKRIYSFQPSLSGVIDGSIHTSTIGSACLYPDLIETQLGNILYPSERYIGRGVRFTATGGSTTTIESSTSDFTALGYAVGDKVTNLKTGIEYTLTVVATTVLTFVASGTETTEEDDEIIAWQDDRFDTDIDKQAWQDKQIYWVKQFKQYDDRIFFTNGNYLGVIGSDEGTGAYNPVTKTGYKADYKQLLVKHQAIAIGVNNAKILVSSSFNNTGVLLLWDGASDGWNNSLKFDRPITALAEYQSGWVFISQGNVYYTDGYQIQTLYSLNSTPYLSDYSVNPTSHNGLVIYENILYCTNGTDDLNLIHKGVYAIDLNNVNKGFTLIKQWGTDKLTGEPTSIFINTRYASFKRIEVCGDFINYITQSVYNGSYFDKSLIMSIPLDDTYKITKIGLNLTRYLKDYNDDDNNDLTRVIQVSVGDGNRGLISRAETKSVGTGTTSFIVDGTAWKNNAVGDEIIVDDKDEDTYGERTFITGITNAGTSTESWDTSPALSTTHNDNTELKILKVKPYGTKTITYDKLKEEVMFPATDNVFSNKLFLEIVIYSNSASFPLSINEINIYGE